MMNHYVMSYISFLAFCTSQTYQKERRANKLQISNKIGKQWIDRKKPVKKILYCKILTADQIYKGSKIWSLIDFLKHMCNSAPKWQSIMNTTKKINYPEANGIKIHPHLHTAASGCLLSCFTTRGKINGSREVTPNYCRVRGGIMDQERQSIKMVQNNTKWTIKFTKILHIFFLFKLLIYDSVVQ